MIKCGSVHSGNYTATGSDREIFKQVALSEAGWGESTQNNTSYLTKIHVPLGTYMEFIGMGAYGRRDGQIGLQMGGG